MGFCYISILFGQLLISGENIFVKAASEDSMSSCAFPCLLQNRFYVKIGDFSDTHQVHHIPDPTRVSLFLSGKQIQNPEECIMRSGPFFMTRRTIEGNKTHGLYKCSKYMLHDNKGNIIPIYMTNPMVFRDIPSICDVCNSKAFLSSIVMKDQNVDCAVVQVPNLGCNTPLVCSVTNSTSQSQCLCEQETLDSGLCCQ